MMCAYELPPCNHPLLTEFPIRTREPRGIQLHAYECGRLTQLFEQSVPPCQHSIAHKQLTLAATSCTQQGHHE